MRSIFFISVFVLLFACSSNKQVEVQGQGNEFVSSVDVLQKDSNLNLQNAVLGTLPFFYGGARGVNIKGIDWTKPVSAENPGVDCELSLHEAKKSDSHFYKCVVKAKDLYVIVSIEEKIVSNKRFMQRIFLDAKGPGYLEQWSSALIRAGYRPRGKKNRLFVSADGKTTASIVWKPKLKAATLRLGPN